MDTNEEDSGYLENNDEKTPLTGTHSQKHGSGGTMDHRIIQYINQRNRNTKWQVFLLVVFSWIAQFHCISSVSVLEHTLLHDYNLSNTEYSLLYTMVFLFAISGSLIAPQLIVQYNLYVALMITQVICMFGQVLAMVGGIIIDADTSENYAANNVYYTFFLIFLYCGRAFIGISFGLSDVILISFVGAWFGNTSNNSNTSNFDANTANNTNANTNTGGNSSWSIIATMISMAHQNLGTISAMYTLTIIDDTNGSLWQCFLLGVLICLLSVFTAYKALLMFNNGKKDYTSRVSLDNEENEDTDDAVNHIARVDNINDGDDQQGYLTDFGKIKHFSLRLWLIILCITIGEANFETFFSQMIEVLIYKYDIDQLTANMVLSSSPIFGMIFIPVFGYISIKYNQNNLFANFCLTISMISFSLSMFIILFDRNNNNGLNNASPWAAMIIENLAIQWWWSSGWTLLYQECPYDMHPIASSTATVFYSIGNIIETLLFGVLADLTNGYDASMMMVAIIPLFGIVAAVLIYYLQYLPRNI